MDLVEGSSTDERLGFVLSSLGGEGEADGYG